jgi:multimeric flavodoxin WrbA
MNVLVLTGSPRPRGNSTILALEVARGAQEAGATVEVAHLARLKINPCHACDACHKQGAPGCVQQDDMQALYSKLRQADALVLSGPVYWFTMGAYTKLFMDRLYAFGAEEYRPLRGKRIGIVLTYADADAFGSGAVNALRAFQDAFAYIQAPIAGMVHASARKAGEITGNAQAMQDALELGRKLVG